MIYLKIKILKFKTIVKINFREIKGLNHEKKYKN
tara:strand:- start:266 stop:367 length:102 start_codon:yes stop_codon:yes gene_type:complete